MRIYLNASVAAVLALAAIAVLPSQHAAAGPTPPSSWPMFMNGALHSSVQTAESRISPATAPLLEPAWIDRDKASQGYYGSSPVVYQRFVYVGDEAGRLTKRDAVDGTARGGWTAHTFNSIYATPAVGPVGTSTMAFVADLSGVVYGINDATGAVRWSHDSPSDGAVFGGPTLVGRTLYTAGLGGDITAWNAATGAVRWSVNPVRPADTRQSGSPTVVDHTVYLGDSAGNLWGVDGSTADPEPLLAFKNGSIPGTVASDGKRLYFTVVYGTAEATDLHAVAYDIASGLVLWDVDLARPAGEVPYDVPSPAVVGEIVLVPTEREVAALNRSTGAVRYRTAMIDLIEPTTPSVANGVFFVGGLQQGGAAVGALAAYRVGTGEPLYFTRIPTVANSTPAVWSGRVYIGAGNVSGEQGNGVLHCFRVSPLAP